MKRIKLNNFTIITSNENFPTDLKPTEIKIINFLEKLPDGVLIDTMALAKTLGIHRSNIYELSSIKEYQIRYKGRLLWGNKKTLKEFAKQTKQKENIDEPEK